MMRVVLDGEILQTRGRIHRYLARQLGFPAHYGHNLDALHDCLTSLCGQTELVLYHWDAPELQGFRRVMEDAAQENAFVTVTVMR